MAISVFPFGSVDVAGVLIDTRISESHRARSTATRFAIDGSDQDITDQIVLDPAEFTIVGWVSNIDESGVALGQRAAEAHAAFQSLNRNRERVDVLTTHVLYEQYVLTSVDTVHEGLTTGAIEVSLTFTEVPQIGETNVPIPASVVSDGEIDSYGRSEAMSAPSEIDAGRKVSRVTEDPVYAFSLSDFGVIQ